MQGYKIGIVGATGLVGKELIKLLEKKLLEQKIFPIKQLFLFASERSEMQKVPFRGEFLKVNKIEKEALQDLDLVFFMADRETSKTFIPLIDHSKTLVIDSSNAFRLDKKVPLIIPEINPQKLKKHHGLIASPNCTAVILLMALNPLHTAFKASRIIASTYQAASGGGAKMLQTLETDTHNYFSLEKKSNHYFGFNLFLHESEIEENKQSQEEKEIIAETEKILGQELLISPTCVRVPVLRAHAISANIKFKKRVNLKKAIALLEKAPGIKLFENLEKNEFATPLMATEQESIYVSRLRQDLTEPNTLEMWIVGDQLLKGAALNALQIAQLLLAQVSKKSGKDEKFKVTLVTG